MATTYELTVQPQNADVQGATSLSIAIIDPNQRHGKEVAGLLNGFSGARVQSYAAYPADLDDLPQIHSLQYDAILVGLDNDPEYAYEVVEGLCACGSNSVMVYSEHTELETAIRFMRVGAREFLTLPLLRTDLLGALERVTLRLNSRQAQRKTARKLLTFLGAKGGCGVTTLAANFAVALAQESGQKTLLIDLGLPLGDAAINLGIIPQYSTANALDDTQRLDPSFLRSLLAKHSSGLAVLAAPGEFQPSQPSHEALDKLIAVARQSFDYVVVDAGSRTDLKGTALFDESASIYLITQVGVSELRNSNRLIAQQFAARSCRMQIVLNRYAPQSLLFDEEQIAKALTKPPTWKVPDDYEAARRTRNTAIPIAMKDSPISRVLRQMARSACGLPAQPEKKRGFFSFGKRS